MNSLSISIEELRNLCVSALTKKGATPEEAGVVFEDYLDAELRGRLSHGFISFPVALGAFPHSGTSSVVAHKGSIITVEGNGDCGHTVARRAIDLALGDLKHKGAYAIGIRNITRFNCPGSIAQYAANRGAIGIVLEYGGQNFMAPVGGKNAALSTNPIGIAVPGTDPLFVVDIATSERAIGYVALAKLSGSAIPSSWGLDNEGRPTSDPQKLAVVSPFGGYKGYALALAFEILSGALVGVPIGAKGTLPRRGAFIILLDPTVFGRTAESFFADVREFLHSVTSTSPLDGSQPVMYPGQASAARAKAMKDMGTVSLPAAALEQIRAASR